ncbi:MAG: TolC family protein, partial [Bacteroidota bacterium]|nr:TolC family protein [Bacteroidota bacterium]
MSQLCFLPKKAKRSRYLLLFCCSRLLLQEKKSQKYFGILFLLNLSLCSFAQEDSILHFSLAQAQSYASQNCYAIRNGLTDIATAKKKVWETTAIGLPQVSGNVTYQNLFNPIDVDFSGFFNNGGSSSSSKMGVIEMMPKSNTTFKLTASQLLFSGEYIVGLKAARTYLDMSEQSLKKSELDTREIVTNTYYQIVIMQRISEILRANAGLMDKTLNDYKEMLKVGMAEETSIDQLRINKTDLDNRLSQTMRGIEILEKLLKFQMGVDINHQIALSDSVETFIKQAMFPLMSTERFK